MAVAGASAASGIGLVAPWSDPLKALKACLAGLTLVFVEGICELLSARCLPCKAAAAVKGGGFGRGRLPGLGEGSFEDSGPLDRRLGGFGGLANAAGRALDVAAGDSSEVSVEDSEGLDEVSAIKG